MNLYFHGSSWICVYCDVESKDIGLPTEKDGSFGGRVPLRLPSDAMKSPFLWLTEKGFCPAGTDYTGGRFDVWRLKLKLTSAVV